MNLRLLADRYAVSRLDPGAPVPAPVSGELWSVTRTANELSVVTPEGAAPEGARVQAGWRAFEAEGPMPFALTGVLAGIAGPLADAGVPVFALATFDTDYVLVPGERLGDALAALTGAGHAVAVV